MGDVDYQLLPAFVRSQRANGGAAAERFARDDIDELLARIDAAQCLDEPRQARSLIVLPGRDG